MREVTVKEFVKAFEGKKVCIESVDSYGIMLSMANAHIEYREEENELVLGGGDYNHGGNAFVSLNVEDTIEAIEEDDGVYTISFIPYMSEVTVEEELPLEEWNYDSDSYDVKQYDCLCTEKVFREGADQGERNTWLGRIIVWLKRQNFTDFKIAQKCKEWNTRCRPPKNLHEFEKEIDGWYKWLSIHGISKIGGCWWSISDDLRVQEIVRKQCDKFHCKQALNTYTSLSISEDVGVRMNQKVLTDGKLSNKGKNKMSGYEYLILTVLDKYMPKTGRCCLTIRDLQYRMQYKKSGKWKLCMDISTFKNTLEALEEHKCITLSDPKRRMAGTVSYDDKIIKFPK